ncbi:hypothetical protein JTB14_021447 [Gonioctena quinquepunctata]|nr:hypothetical protein JTB14_021447 [Gonioctena quinquepunctata]
MSIHEGFDPVDTCNFNLLPLNRHSALGDNASILVRKHSNLFICFEKELIGGEVGDDGQDNVSDSEHDTYSEQSDNVEVAVENNTVVSKGEEGEEEMEVENNDSSQQSDYNYSADGIPLFHRLNCYVGKDKIESNDSNGYGIQTLEFFGCKCFGTDE